MARSRYALSVLSTSVLLMAAFEASGQVYPTKPIRVLTGLSGGGADTDARLITPGLSIQLNQPVIVDNRDPLISAELASKAPSDGYTLFLSGSVFYIAPIFQKLSYDPVRSFAPVTLMSRSVDLLVVNAALPVTSVKELIALAKSKPGELNYASGPTGSPPHLSAELFKSIAGINIVRVPYKGGAPALNAVLGGEVQLTFSTASVTLSHIKAGKLRALGVTSGQASTLVPGIPPIAASLPGYESLSTTGIYAPAGIPAAILNRVSQEVSRLLKASDMRERFLSLGEEIIGDTPEEATAAVKAEIAKWSKLVKDANIKVDQ